MQNYSNHIRFNPLHHFIITPLTLIFFVWSIVRFTNAENSVSDSIYYLIAATAILLTALISRMYATKNQDRLIRIEMRLRYFELTGKSLTSIENKLSLSQIIALRFAGDSELLGLIDKTMSQNLSSKEIKQAITNWQADLNRV